VPKNVDIAERFYEWLSDRSVFDDWDWFFRELALPDFEVRPAEGQLPDIPDESFRGPAGMAKFWRTLGESFEDVHFNAKEIRPGPGDYVVALVQTALRGRGSEVPIEFREAHVWTIRDGKAARIDVYLDWAAGLQAAGLRE
jgi:ketosteroid isomerase-like protein